MSKLIAIRVEDSLLGRVDKESRRAGISRATAVKQALALWIERRQHAEAMRADQEGYKRRPVGADEFRSVLGAQVWPR